MDGLESALIHLETSLWIYMTAVYFSVLQYSYNTDQHNDTLFGFMMKFSIERFQQSSHSLLVNPVVFSLAPSTLLL